MANKINTHTYELTPEELNKIRNVPISRYPNTEYDELFTSIDLEI